MLHSASACQPHRVSDATLFLPPLPPSDAVTPRRDAALQRLLSRASFSSRACEDSTQWACEAFGVARQQDWPVAPLSLRGEGSDPGTDYWLCATPVHMQVRRDQMLLMPPHLLTIAPDEAAALLSTLESHFARDGLAFRAPAPQRWYLRCANRPDLQTTSLERAAGRHVDPLLPAGPHRMAFHHLINEVQMLLHEHPVNLQREARNLPAINSVWLWGGGTLPAAARSPWPAVATSRPLERGLAQLAGVPAASSQAATDAAGLYSLADADPSLESVDRDWAAPLLAQLSSGALGRLDIATVQEGRAKQWTLTRADLWKFWRRDRPLESFFSEPAT